MNTLQQALSWKSKWQTWDDYKQKTLIAVQYLDNGHLKISTTQLTKKIKMEKIEQKSRLQNHYRTTNTNPNTWKATKIPGRMYIWLPEFGNIGDISFNNTLQSRKKKGGKMTECLICGRIW